MGTLASYKHTTCESEIHFMGVRWKINTGRFAKKQTRCMRVRYLQKGITQMMDMLQRYRRVLEVRLDSHSDHYEQNNVEWRNTFQQFLERLRYQYGEVTWIWCREMTSTDHNAKPHYHVVLWLNGHDIERPEPIQALWEEIHHMRQHARPYDWKGSLYPQARELTAIPQGVSDYAERLSYLCKLSTKGFCVDAYDFYSSRGLTLK